MGAPQDQEALAGKKCSTFSDVRYRPGVLGRCLWKCCPHQASIYSSEMESAIRKGSIAGWKMERKSGTA